MKTRKRTYVCGACGKTNDNRDDFKDVSCFLHAVEVYEDTIKRGEDGKVVFATAVKND